MLRKILLFTLEQINFGIMLRDVKEVNNEAEWIGIPRSLESVYGLMNMRGKIVTILNFPLILSINSTKEEGADYKTSLSDKKKTGKTTSNICIVLKGEEEKDGGFIGFLIPKEMDIIEVDDGLFREVPSNIKTLNKEYINNVLDYENNIVLILNKEKFFDVKK